MINLLKKTGFFLIVLIMNIIIKFIEWAILSRKFIPNKIENVDYDIIDYTRLFFISLHEIFLFTDISFFLVLSICLLFKSKINTELLLNIYYSLFYLFISIVIIECLRLYMLS